MALGIEATREFDPIPSSYNLSEQQIQEICDNFINSYNENLSAEEKLIWPELGCYRISGFDGASDMGRYVEAKAKKEAFGTSAEQLAASYTLEEENNCEFLIVIDHRNKKPVGVLRMTRSSGENELKTVSEIENYTNIPADEIYDELGASRDSVLDIGAFAILPEYRARKSDTIEGLENYRGEQTENSPSLLLLRGLYHHISGQPGISHIVGISNSPVEKSLKELEVPFRPIQDMEPFPYGNLSENDDDPSKLARGIFIPATEIFPTLNDKHEEYKTRAILHDHTADIWNANGDTQSAIEQWKESNRILTLAMKMGALIDPLRTDLDASIETSIIERSGTHASRSWLEKSNEVPDSEEAQLRRRFHAPRIRELALDYLKNGPYGDIRERLANKKHVMIVVDATDSRFADLGKAPETIVFATSFNRTFKQVYDEYTLHDPNSQFIVDLDISNPDYPIPAGAIRMMQGNTINDLKSIKDLVIDSPDNPWLEELKELLFAPGETYDPQIAWDRLCEKNGVELNPWESSDVATLAVFSHNGRKESMYGVSARLYHSCANLAIARGMKNMVSIQDVKPFRRLQEYAGPFDTFDGIMPHPYGGPYDTIPAYCVVSESVPRVRANDWFVANILLDGMGLAEDAYLLKDLDPVQYGERRRTTARFIAKAQLVSFYLSAKKTKRKIENYLSMQP